MSIRISNFSSILRTHRQRDDHGGCFMVEPRCIMCGFGSATPNSQRTFIGGLPGKWICPNCPMYGFKARYEHRRKKRSGCVEEITAA